MTWNTHTSRLRCPLPKLATVVKARHELAARVRPRLLDGLLSGAYSTVAGIVGCTLDRRTKRLLDTVDLPETATVWILLGTAQKPKSLELAHRTLDQEHSGPRPTSTLARLLKCRPGNFWFDIRKSPERGVFVSRSTFGSHLSTHTMRTRPLFYGTVGWNLSKNPKI